MGIGVELGGGSRQRRRRNENGHPRGVSADDARTWCIKGRCRHEGRERIALAPRASQLVRLDDAQEIREAVRANGKATTQEERIVIGMHWRHTMRLFRVRHFAEKANDMATVGRCDGLLSKADTKFFAKLAELNAKAPPKEAKDAKAGDGGAPPKGEHKGDGKGKGEGKGDKDKAEKKGDKQ